MELDGLPLVHVGEVELMNMGLWCHGPNDALQVDQLLVLQVINGLLGDPLLLPDLGLSLLLLTVNLVILDDRFIVLGGDSLLPRLE